MMWRKFWQRLGLGESKSLVPSVAQLESKKQAEILAERKTREREQTMTERIQRFVDSPEVKTLRQWLANQPAGTCLHFKVGRLAYWVDSAKIRLYSSSVTFGAGIQLPATNDVIEWKELPTLWVWHGAKPREFRKFCSALEKAELLLPHD